MKFISAKFAQDIESQLKRGDTTRSIGFKAKVSASTMSRVLSCKGTPDLISYAKLCKHFKLKMEDYLK